MAPTMKSMKKATGVKGAAAGLKSRSNSVRSAIQHAGECSDRLKQMLCASLSSTIGTHKVERHPFNERFVTMIDQVLTSEGSRLNNDIASKETAFAYLTPARATREAALEAAKAVAAEKGEALAQAKQAVTEVAASVKEAAAAVKEAIVAQKSGDEELEGISAKKAMLEDTQRDSFAPLVAGTEDDKDGKIKAVMGVGKSFHFDSSLMQTVVQVLQREASERGGFDATTLDQLQAAFATTIAGFDEQLAAGAPGKAERAAAVQNAEAAKAAAEASQADLKEKAAAAKEAKAAADGAQKAAAKSLEDFIPDIKTAGNALDDAKKALELFSSGPRSAFQELKEFKEGDFVPKRTYYEKIDGLSCDRAVIDECRAAVTEGNATPGRVSLDDAKKVFEKIADGGKETRAERWTLRYCLHEFQWSEAAHDWIIEELTKVPQEEAPAKRAKTEGPAGYYEVVDGYKCDRAIVDACREAVAAQGDGRVSMEDAERVWAKAADGNKVTNAEKWTLRYCLSNFHWTRAAHDWVLEQLHKEAAPAAPSA